MVDRKHVDFLWLHQQLRREFPGLRLPGPPENNFESVSQFMDAIAKNELLFRCYLTQKFCLSKDETVNKEFAKKRELMYPEPDGMEKFRSFFSETVTATKAELELVSRKALTLPNIERSMTADYNTLADTILETSTAIHVFMATVKKNLVEIEQALNGVADRFKAIAQTLQSVITILKRLNFAKTQFPLFEESHLNLDIMFIKLKDGFESACFLNSKSRLTSLTHRRIFAIYAIRRSTQRHDFYVENACETDQR